MHPVWRVSCRCPLKEINTSHRCSTPTAFSKAFCIIQKICTYAWNDIRDNFVSEYISGNVESGYVLMQDGTPGVDQLSYPKFEITCGSRTYRISMRYGLWNGTTYEYQFQYSLGGSIYCARCDLSSDATTLAAAFYYYSPGLNFRVVSIDAATGSADFEADFTGTGIYQNFPQQIVASEDGSRIVYGGWGDQFNTHLVNRESLQPVMSIPGNQSPYGLFDMAGNAAEWVSDWYAAYPRDDGDIIPKEITTRRQGYPDKKYKVYRGGGFNSFGKYLRCANREREKPDKKYSAKK